MTNKFGVPPCLSDRIQVKYLLQLEFLKFITSEKVIISKVPRLLIEVSTA